MPAYDKRIASKRLRALRTKKGWSQNMMAKELNGLLGQNGLYADIYKPRILSEDTGRFTVSQLENIKGKENDRGITIQQAFAYADIFDVSVDYVLGRIDDLKPQFKEAKEVTGLSDEAIRALENYKYQYATAGYYESTGLKIQKDERNKAAIYNLLNLVLADEMFWNEFNDRLNNIFCLLNKSKSADKAASTIDVEKYHIVKSFEKLLDDCIGMLKPQNNLKQNKLF